MCFTTISISINAVFWFLQFYAFDQIDNSIPASLRVYNSWQEILKNIFLEQYYLAKAGEFVEKFVNFLVSHNENLKEN